MLPRRNPEGQDTAVDEAMREEREVLDSMQQQQIERQPMRESIDYDYGIDGFGIYGEEEDEEEMEEDAEDDSRTFKAADDKALVYLWTRLMVNSRRQLREGYQSQMLCNCRSASHFSNSRNCTNITSLSMQTVH